MFLENTTLVDHSHFGGIDHPEVSLPSLNLAGTTDTYLVITSRSKWVWDPDYLNLAGTTVKLIIWTGGQKRLSYTYTLGNLGMDNHDMISKEMFTCL